MEYCAHCKCETPSIGVTIEKRGTYTMESSHCCFCGWARSKVVFYSFLLE